MAYYNTTDLKHQDLQTSVGKAKHQDEKVLEYFKEHPIGMFSPEDVHQAIFTSSVPLTSTRRSFHTLEKGLFIQKTGTYKQGLYGKRVNCWKLKVTNS